MFKIVTTIGTRSFINNNLSFFSIFNPKSCDRIYRYAAKFGVAKDKVEEFLKKYIPIAIAKGKDAYKDVKEFTKQAFDYVKKWVCSNTIFCDDNSQNDEMIAYADEVNFFDMDLIKQKVLECEYSAESSLI